MGDCFLLKWWTRWLENGWRNGKGKPLANKVLWERLLTQNAIHQIEWIRIPGHDERYPLNQLCDHLAVAEKLRYIHQAA